MVMEQGLSFHDFILGRYYLLLRKVDMGLAFNGEHNASSLFKSKTEGAICMKIGEKEVYQTAGDLGGQDFMSVVQP